MAKTLLNAVNDLFKRTGIIAGDANALTSLTDAARQHDIDAAVQVVNEGIDELYTSCGTARPQQQAESTITLVTNTRNYTLATNFVRLHWPLIDKTHGQFLYEYDGDYDDILSADPEQIMTGTPYYGVVRPTDSALYIFPSPDSSVNGNVYTYQYDKDTELSAYTDTVPFNNFVYRAMLPCWVQLWGRERRNAFDKDLFKLAVGRAARALSQEATRSNYSPR